MAAWLGLGGTPTHGYLVEGDVEDVASLLSASQYVRVTLEDDRTVILNRDHVCEITSYWGYGGAAPIEAFTPRALTAGRSA